MTDLEHSSIRGRTEAMRMVLLTFCTIGITFTWGIEMTYCTPYLLDLGLSKSNTSLVWVAGPLSGLIVQPVVGVLSDESTSRWGRRRPIMVIGAAVVAVSLVVLGFTKQLLHSVFDETASSRAIIVVAVMAIYIVDFAINAVMSCSRSLIVDTLSIEKQQAGAAWASRMSAIGHMIGYSAGAVDMVGTFGTTLGDTQFQQLTIIAAVAIIVCTAVTCWAVSEKAFTADRALQSSGSGFKIFGQIYQRLIHLPPRVQAICWAQFWSWIGWFPFLFYSTTWVGETYFRYDVAVDKKSADILGQIGRVGSTAFVIYSIITLLGALFLPLVVRAPDEQSYTRRLPSGFLGKFVARMEWDKPDLLSTWMFGHLAFAGAMLLSPFATSYRFATVLVCLCGLPWTIAMWAPTALLGVEVNKMAAGHSYQQVGHEMVDREIPRLDAQADKELSGVYFGILNIYTTLPQFIGTFISSIVFSILEPSKSDNKEGGQFAVENASGPNAISICLFIGALSSIGAGYATKRLKAL